MTRRRDEVRVLCDKAAGLLARILVSADELTEPTADAMVEDLLWTIVAVRKLRRARAADRRSPR